MTSTGLTATGGKTNTRQDLRALSLFSGIGGLDLGFARSGFDVLAAAEIDATCCETLRANSDDFGVSTEVAETDLTTVVPEDLCRSDIDLIVGGPPCQSFSAIGRRAGGAMGHLDSRGTLFEHYCRLVAHYQPRAFVFENVRGILSSHKGKDWESILHAFVEIGYTLKYRVLDAAMFGVAQHRERVFLVGYRDGEFQFPRPTHGPDSAGNIPYVSAAEAVQGCADSDDPALRLAGGKYDHLLDQVPPGSNYLHFTREMGHPSPVFAWRSRFSDFLYKADPGTPVKTIVAQMGRYSGPFHWDNRRLSIRELARLQGFPDDFILAGSRAAQAKQIGNSVVPAVAESIALALRQTLLADDQGIEVLEDHAVLTNDARKAGKAKVTRSKRTHHSQLTLATKDRMKIGSKVPQPPEQTRSRGPWTDGASGARVFMEYSSPRLVTFSSRRTRGSYCLKWNQESLGRHAIEFWQSGVASRAGFVTYQLEFEDLPGSQLSHLQVTLRGARMQPGYVIWDVVNLMIRELTTYPSIHELFGHFTEPNPAFIMRATTNAWDGLTSSMRILVECSARSGSDWEFEMAESARFGLKGKPETWIADLRAERLDVRSNLTNKTIPDGVFHVCYPFALPAERLDCVLVRAA